MIKTQSKLFKLNSCKLKNSRIKTKRMKNSNNKKFKRYPKKASKRSYVEVKRLRNPPSTAWRKRRISCRMLNKCSMVK